MKNFAKVLICLAAVIFMAVAVMPAAAAAESEAEDNTRSLLTLDDLEGKTAAVMTGTPQDQMVTDSVKDAKLLYFNNFSDLILAVESGKADFFVNSTIAFRLIHESYPDLQYVEQVVRTFDIGTIFPKTDKGENLCGQLNEYIAKITENGSLDELKNYWLYVRDWEAFDIPETGENGVLKLATTTTNKPFSMMVNGKFAGFEIAILTGFAEEYGYGLSIEDVDMAGALSGLATEKYDMAAGQISWTQERAEKVLYSDFYVTQDIVPIVKAGAEDSGSGETFFESMAASFKRTFVDEARWKMILSGLGITMLITVCGFILANILGMLFCALAMSKHKPLNIIADIYSKLMQGMPMVVILMILYYIIFGKADISGVIVSVIGFGITSGAYLAQLFQGGISGVDKGQMEAALAMGFTKVKAFNGIVLPQAVRHMLPGYFSQFINLLKGTAIVGYIAVADITKVGDIIRSTTYEAFFPLICVAVIYFAIACILLTVLKKIQKRLEPKRSAQIGGEK